jgi:hypothetical protein
MRVDISPNASAKMPRYCEFVLRLVLSDRYDSYMADVMSKFLARLDQKNLLSRLNKNAGWTRVSKTFEIPNFSVKLKIWCDLTLDSSDIKRKVTINSMSFVIVGLMGSNHTPVKELLDEFVTSAFESQILNALP